MIDCRGRGARWSCRTDMASEPQLYSPKFGVHFRTPFLRLDGQPFVWMANPLFGLTL